MENVLGKVKARLVREGQRLADIFVGAFFDDVGIATDTEKDHLVVLEALLKECDTHQIRVKLQKCEFLQTSMEYLGFEVGHLTWSPSKKKVAAILQAKVTNVKELQSFLGCNKLFQKTCSSFL